MSTAKFDTLSTLDGSRSVPVNTVAQGSAKAWVNFNGTGTVAIRASFNVSSITDNGTGDYTVNFTASMPDANYALSGTSCDTTATSTTLLTPALVAAPLLAASSRVQTRNTGSGAVFDATIISIAIFD